MSNLDNIFDLPEGEKQEEQQEKKPRKKTEMSDNKKVAMLERLKAGREKRAENLKAKTQPKEDVVIKKETVSNSKEANKEVISKKKDTVLKKTDNKQNKTDSYEDEKLSFIKMMAGKSKPVEKVERRKKKFYAEPKEEQKQEVITKPIAAPISAAPIAAAAKPMAAPVVIAAPVVKVPVIIRTFKKPIWG